jgi:hypothetical protein
VTVATARDTFVELWELETLAFDRQAALAKLSRITQSDANLGFGRCGGITLLLINQGAPVPRPVSWRFPFSTGRWYS